MDFFGRAKELERLNVLFDSHQSEFVPIYGRRRVGKSELILKFIHNKPALYFLGKQALPELQIREFLQEAARVFKQPLLATADVKDWKSAFDLVEAQRAGSKKWILVLDEFQWMVESSPELPSILQDRLDRDWKKSKNMMLILCGSYMGFMEKEVLGEKSPLFGRRTAQIHLKPFSYKEAALFHSRWSLPDKAMAYMICGGIPLYLNFFKTGQSVYKNIENNFFDEFSPLFREPEFLLREELRELKTYYSLLMSLATKSLTSSELAQMIGVDDRKLYYYLQTLIDLGCVRRYFPITGQKPNPKMVRFIVSDPLLRFWFRFVYPHMAFISQRNPHESFLTLVKPHLESYLGSCFEILCQEALAELYCRDAVDHGFEIGQYWDKNVQIDIVGVRQNEGVDLGECKWGKMNSIKSVLAEIEQKKLRYPNVKGLSLQAHLFLQKKSKIKLATSDVLIHDLADIYKI